MRNKIFGGIGMVWGALILANWLMNPPAGAGAYAFFKKPAPKKDP